MLNFKNLFIQIMSILTNEIQKNHHPSLVYVMFLTCDHSRSMLCDNRPKNDYDHSRSMPYGKVHRSKIQICRVPLRMHCGKDHHPTMPYDFMGKKHRVLAFCNSWGFPQDGLRSF